MRWERRTGSDRKRVATLGRVGYPLENALFQWEEGLRALRAIEAPRERRLADRVVAAIQDELRRRIGPTFSAAELADLYGRGTDWCLQVASDAAPSSKPTASRSPTPPSGSTCEALPTSPAAAS